MNNNGINPSIKLDFYGACFCDKAWYTYIKWMQAKLEILVASFLEI